MKKRKYVFSGLVFVMLIIGGVALISRSSEKDKITFYLHKKPSKQIKEIVEYGSKISIHPKDIGLLVMDGQRDVTRKVRVQRVNFKQLRTYKIRYQYHSETFLRLVQVVDRKKPNITGKEEFEMMQGEVFDIKKLGIQAIDNYDGDISSSIKINGHVDGNTPGSYRLTFEVMDSSKNKAEFISTVLVKKKQEVNRVINNAYEIVDNPNGITTLVNKKHILPDGWAPNDLTEAESGFYLRLEAADAWLKMKQAASTQGVFMNIVSAYRSQAYQSNLYQQYYATDPVNTPYFSAQPRRSEHEMGLAIDVSNGDYQLHDDLESTATGIWLNDNAYKYGWILRYPNGKTNVTGYAYEAWHYRYVGVDLAHKLKASGLTLDEY